MSELLFDPRLALFAVPTFALTAAGGLAPGGGPTTDGQLLSPGKGEHGVMAGQPLQGKRSRRVEREGAAETFQDRL